ncbi:NitT/TauT family transport system substrate-binding protein [Arboricoccus pini]|uniref:NitT/TauT family transport system substrate-binding protein n=1 Tax=Arboricoccus pini TaxID=1963835 RepID=A0A212RR10_9PROT|nr:ABC transporter substrate-binding protein [Arboricoccus pini]SNB74918.1 NitT/TauT family transport system substrate-binding protein [Arboricoccus pini]
MTFSSLSQRPGTRRALLASAGAIGFGSALGVLGGRLLGATPPAWAADELCLHPTLAAADAVPSSQRKKLTIAWSPAATCISPIGAAYTQGIFAKHGLDVEFVSFGNSTDQLLEAIATGKADAGVGMALRWLKALEQGFDVKVTAGTHGGCMALLASSEAGIKTLADLKGKTIAVADMASPAKNFFSIMLAKNGLDPLSDVEWRQYPADLLPIAIEKREAHALAEGDPRTYIFLKNSNGKLFQLASNLSGEYANRACCILGIRGTLIREDRETAAALTKAVVEAHQAAFDHPQAVAEYFASQTPGVSVEDIVGMLKGQTHHHHPTDVSLRDEIARYAEELKLVQVFKPSTDPQKFADSVYADVLTV